MAIRRNAPPRKKPSEQQTPMALGAKDAKSVEQSSSDGGTSHFDAQEAARGLLADFESALRGSSAGSTGEEQALTDQFAAALRDVAANGDFSAVPDKAAWQSAVEDLQQSGSLTPNESRDLLQQLDIALAPLEKQETKVALEFSRRMQSDGQERALAWLREQQEGSGEETEETSGSQIAPNSRPAQLSGDEITQSRSRRVRGPPRQK